MPEFPAGLPDIGRALVGTDEILVNKARSDLSRVLSYVEANIAAGSASGVQVISTGGSHAIAEGTDLVVLTGTASVTLVAPSPSEGRRFTVKNAVGGAKTIEVQPADVGTVERGNALTSYGEGQLACSWTWEHDGVSTWRLVASDDDRYSLRIAAREVLTEASHIREAAGPTTLALGAVADGQFLRRSGASVVGASAPVGPYELLWRWNGTDLTEFDAVGDAGFTPTVTTWGALASTDDPTPALQISNPATSGGFYGLLVKSALLPTITNPTRLLVICRWSNTMAAGTQDLMFMPYYEAPTWFIGTRRSFTQYQWLTRDGSTTYVDLVTWGPAISNADAMMGMEFLISPASASQRPWVQGQGTPFDQPAAASIPRARSAYAAGWQSIGSYSPRIGWGVRTYGAASAGNALSQMAIYRVNR